MDNIVEVLDCHLVIWLWATLLTGYVKVIPSVMILDLMMEALLVLMTVARVCERE